MRYKKVVEWNWENLKIGIAISLIPIVIILINTLYEVFGLQINSNVINHYTVGWMLFVVMILITLIVGYFTSNIYYKKVKE